MKIRVLKSQVYGYLGTVKILLDHGARADKIIDGYSALIGASIKGNSAIVKLLLDEGAFVDAADKYGSAPLLLAA